MAEGAGGAKKSVAKLNNVLMQMRKNANHPGGAAFSGFGSLARALPKALYTSCMLDCHAIVQEARMHESMRSHLALRCGRCCRAQLLSQA